MFDRRETANPATNIALRIAIAFAFVVTGGDKFLGGYWPSVFATIGLGQWFRYFTGSVEMLGGLLFLIPRATTLGAAILVATMLGAMAAQCFVFRSPAASLFPALYLGGVIVAYTTLRRDRLRAATNERPGKPGKTAGGVQ